MNVNLALRGIAALVLSVVALVGCAAPNVTVVAPRIDANAAFLKLADRHAARIFATSPEWASQMGVDESIAGSGFRRRLADYSPAGNARLVALNLELLAELKAVDRTALTETAAITYDVMLNAYELAARQNEFGVGNASLLWVNQPYALDQLFGAHIGLPRLFAAQMPVTNAQQLDDYLARLDELGAAIDGAGALLLDDANAGVIPPRFVLEAVAEATLAYAEPAVDEHPLVTALSNKIAALDDLGARRKRAANQRLREIVLGEVAPAFLRLAARIESLLQRAPEAPGLWRLPNGAKMYQLALENYGATGLTADEIHEIGLADVARIHEQMDSILQGLGYAAGSVGDRMQALATAPEMLRPNTDEEKARMLSEAEGHIDNIMAIAGDWFGTIPPQPVVVKRIPALEEGTSSGAYYLPPALDGSAPGTFWINLKDTADWPRYALESLVYHEAVPGHHFQASVQQFIDDMPLIRNMMWFADYGEGWALYTEALAVEMGMYDGDPLGNLGRLRMELYRAARLVVDTGVHDRRWGRDKAIDWMVAATGETRDSIAREIDRYAVWPGQATSYKLGMIKFQRLRAAAEAELGDAFDIRAFHDALLTGGNMPMAVLEAQMTDWVAAQKVNQEVAASFASETRRPQVLPEACETSLALSAAPEYLRDAAGVLVMRSSGYDELRPTSNGFTCIVNRDHPSVLKPTCFDRVGTQSVIPTISYRAERMLRGDALEDINADVARAFETGRFKSQSGAGVAYMLSRYNRPVNRQTGELGFFPPHVMFHAPNLSNEDIGHDMRFHDPAQPLPMIAYGGPQGYMLMISDDGEPRRRSDLDASCPDWIWEE